MMCKWESLPRLARDVDAGPAGDWLVRGTGVRAGVHRTSIPGEIVLDNGLVRRTFRIIPNGATVDYTNLMTGESIIRSVRPEATITIDGVTRDVGGLAGQEEHAYLLPAWIDAMAADPAAFTLVDVSWGPIKERFPWKRVRHATATTWPPAGVELVLTFVHGDLPGIAVDVHHEIHDGLPLLAKWLVVRNDGPAPVTVDAFVSEILAVVESSSVPQGDGSKSTSWAPLHLESDYIFSAMSPAVANVTTRWEADTLYTSQVAYTSDAKVLLLSKPPVGPCIRVEPGSSFASFRTWELVHDSTDRERRGLALRRMYRTIAPWVTENPIFFHVTTADPDKVKPVIDQAAGLGFEMAILSFGSGVPEIEAWIDEPEFIAEFKALFGYAHDKGIEIGAYSLFSSRTIDTASDVVPPAGTTPTFGHAPCLCSAWGKRYLDALQRFIVETGADFLEHDGPYPGDVCTSTSHPGHDGACDSQWRQWEAQSGFYTWCRARGVYVNQPDWYFLSGGSKTGMGYKEVNWSLPRERQVIIGRQNIYDGTWEKTPSMGWMFTPLSVYHPHGEHWRESTLEPLADHLDLYEEHLSHNLLAGVQSCYRGPRLYDAPATRDMVKRWIDTYKKHRAILESDIIHLRRPDGRHVDAILHVNPTLEEKGLAVFFNPTDEIARETFHLPLYYTGLETEARVSREDGPVVVYPLDRQHRIDLPVEVPPRGRAWYVIS